MKLIRYTTEDGFKRTVNVEQVIEISYHDHHPQEGKPFIKFRYAGDSEGVVIWGEEATRVWGVVNTLPTEANMIR